MSVQTTSIGLNVRAENTTDIQLLQQEPAATVTVTTTTTNVTTIDGGNLPGTSDITLPNTMYVTKRNGRTEGVSFDKITKRLVNFCFDLDSRYVDPTRVAIKVIAGLYPGVTTSELDELSAQVAASMIIRHPDYGTLAVRVAVSNLHKKTPPKFSEAMRRIHEAVDRNGKRTNQLDGRFYELVIRYADRLDAAVKHELDYTYDYFGFETLVKSYLMHVNGEPVERPQYMLMRVSLGIHGDDLDKVLETYVYMSLRLFTHASPTLFSCGTSRPRLSSCLLVALKEDSIDGVFDTLHSCAMISKGAGDIGLDIHDLRAKGSPIRGGQGTAGGVVPMLRVFNNAARYVSQGGNKQPGAFAIYLETWHADIFDFISLRKNNGVDEMRARDLSYGLWVSDLFMRRVDADEMWSLMCPNRSPGLADAWGHEFEQLYESYESRGMYERRVPARRLMMAVVESQVETGVPYMLYKDTVNARSNQKNLGTIRCSNLSTEIVQYSSRLGPAVCNLASIAVNRFWNTVSEAYEFDELRKVAGIVTVNLNRVIDVSVYPSEEAATTNRLHRPIGIGIQGLADLFLAMRLPFDHPTARLLNVQIMETIYFGALESSCELARRDGCYASYAGSPASNGLLQMDMWGHIIDPINQDWTALRASIRKYGLRNSQLTALMPTATTSQIMGNNDSFEPITNNVCVRRTMSGDFQVVNLHLIRDLIALDLWNEDTKEALLRASGSVQGMEGLPADLKRLYRTVWEIPQKTLMIMAAERGPFVDQSQSLNMYMADPTAQKMLSLHMYTWRLGLKTGMYYLRVKPATQPIQFSLGTNTSDATENNEESRVNATSVIQRPTCNPSINDGGESVCDMRSA